MVYGMTTGGRKGVEYRAVVLHSYCNRVGNARGGACNKRMIDSCTKSLDMKESLVKAKRFFKSR